MCDTVQLSISFGELRLQHPDQSAIPIRTAGPRAIVVHIKKAVRSADAAPLATTTSWVKVTYGERTMKTAHKSSEGAHEWNTLFVIAEDLVVTHNALRFELFEKDSRYDHRHTTSHAQILGVTANSVGLRVI